MAGHSAYSVVGSVMPEHYKAKDSQERIYSAKQLVDALRSGLAAVKDQLGVLAILDGTATSWPGVNQSLEDLAFIVDASIKTTTTLDLERTSFNVQLTDSLQQINALKATLAGANKAKEDAEHEAAAATKSERAARAAEAGAVSELQITKQELWSAEKERADLAQQAEKQKQEAEYRDAQLGDLRSANSDQAHKITYMKEDLAARKAEVVQLTRSGSEQRQQLSHLTTQLERTTQQLQEAQGALNSAQGEKLHYEREAHRLSEEAGRLSADLEKAVKEVQRLKEWNDVVKKLEHDKAVETEQKATATRVEFDKKTADLEARIQALHREVACQGERLRGKESEMGNQAKQLALQNLSVKELQKQLAAASAERASVGRQRDEARAAGVKYQSQLHTLNLRLQENEKSMILSDGAAREALLADRATLTAQLDEALKDAAVYKALAEGWQRDIRSCKNMLAEANSHTAVLQATIDKLSRDVESSKVDAIKANVTLEQQLRNAQAQVSTKENDMKKVQFEAQSTIKALQKTVERLQRENDTAAEEVQRLRQGDVGFVRLPAVGKRPSSMQDDLANLRRVLVNNVYNQNSHSPAMERTRMADGGPAGMLDLLPNLRHQTR